MKKKPIVAKTLFNPTMEDLEFEYDSTPYRVKAGKTSEPWIEHITVHGAKKLADKNVMTSNPDEHRVLMTAYLENSEPEVIAKNLGIDLEKIRKEALTKEKEKARVLNLEDQVATLARQVAKLTEEKTTTVKTEEETPKKMGRPKGSKNKDKITE